MSPLDDTDDCARRCTGFLDCFSQSADTALSGLGAVLPYVLAVLAAFFLFGLGIFVLGWLFCECELRGVGRK